MRIDLGGGANPQPGFINVDVRPLPQVDIVQDLTTFPWDDIPDECAQIVMASHLIEHIPPHNFTFVNFMNEVWRITKPGGQFMIAMPYGLSPGFIQDPTHCNPCNQTTWKYFDPLNDSMLWTIYQPKPWYYAHVSFDVMWSMEVLLIRHSEDMELWEKERAQWKRI